jgi:hypothetical protein
MGIILFTNGVGPVVGNAIYDVTRSYDLMLLGTIAPYVLASLLFLLLRPVPRSNEEALDVVAEAEVSVPPAAA